MQTAVKRSGARKSAAKNRQVQTVLISQECLMKQLQVGLLIFALALPAPVPAADSAPPTHYTATVLDDQGRLVAGATVDCYYHQSFEGFGYRDREPELTQRTVTDSNGAFVVASAPGSILAVVKKPGLATAWKTWSTMLTDSSEPVILTAPTALAGIVLDENNRPVAGADVWVAQATMGYESGWAEIENQLLGKPARECFSTKTAADGRFRIGNFPAGAQAGLAVKITGRAQHPLESAFTPSLWQCRSGDEDIELRVGPAGAVEGKVAVAETGQPLGGVKIKLEPMRPGIFGPEYRETVESGADGSFRIPDVQPGIYGVQAYIPGQPVPDWVVSGVKLGTSQLTVTAGETVHDVEISASKGVLVQVSVVSTNDLMPLVGVPVSSVGATVYTGINGMALFRVPAGKAYFSARNDWISQQREAVIEDGHATNIWIELIPPPTITGTVRDPSGVPVPGVLVSFHPGEYPDAPDYSEVTTDKNGRYEIILKLIREDMEWIGPICETNCIVARDAGRNLADIQEFVKIPDNLDLNLQPGITLSGSVKDTQGAPVANATLELDFLLGNMGAHWTPRPAKVNAQGSFSFPAMPQGRQYFIEQLTAKGCGTASTEIKAEITKTNHYEFPTFVLKRADRKLAGQVLGLDGKPAAGLLVSSSGEGQPLTQWRSPSAKSGSDGHFVIDEVCEGPVTVSASSGNIRGNAPAQGGDTNVVVRLGVNLVTYGQNPTPPRKIAGTVRDASGAPADGVTMSLFPAQVRVIDSQTDSAGRYEFNWQPRAGLEETNWLLARDFKGGLAAIQQVNTNATNLDLTLQEGLTISTKVLDGSGRALTNATATVTVWAEPRRGYGLNPQPMLRSDDGRFRLNALPQGLRYWINIEVPGYSPARLDAEAEDTKTNLLQLPPCVLGLKDVKLAGVVLDVDGNPAPLVSVRLIARDEPGQTTTTDTDGHFAFDGLGHGPLIINVGNGAGGATATGGNTNLVIQMQRANAPNRGGPSAPVTTSGAVFDPSGAPAPAVFLSTIPAVGRSTPVQSDAGGNYTIQWQTMPYPANSPPIKTLLVGRDLEHNWAATAPMYAATTNLDLHLQPGLTLSGSVRDAAGNPLANACLQLILSVQDRGWGLNRFVLTNADAQGFFSISALPPGANYVLHAAAAGHGSNNIPVPPSVSEAAQFQLPPIVLKVADRQLAGQVIGLDGLPCLGAQVSMSGEGQNIAPAARTDSNGHFIIQQVCEGPVDVSATIPSSINQGRIVAGETRANGGDTNIVIKLGATNAVPTAPPVRGGQSY
jgi:protocatechuate 3,4-dioxygenase beta subunit